MLCFALLRGRARGKKFHFCRVKCYIFNVIQFSVTVESLAADLEIVAVVFLYILCSLKYSAFP